MTSGILRILRLAVPLTGVIGGLALSGCAGNGAVRPNDELARLEASCKARGGILIPTESQTGRESVDNVCRISDGPSDRLRPRN